MDLDPPFPKLPVRRRLLIVLLAVATAATVVLTLVSKPGGAKGPRPPVPEPARCVQGQQLDCVGGTAQVIVPATATAPATAPAPAASAAR